MTIITVIFVAFFMLMLIGIIANKTEVQKVLTKSKQQLSKIDSTYESFINNQINLLIIKEESIDWDRNALLEETMVILKPHIDGLIANINSTKIKSITIEYSSPYFDNIVRLMEEKYVVNANSKEKILSQEDETDLYEAFVDAINADISKRIVDFKSGNL